MDMLMTIGLSTLLAVMPIATSPAKTGLQLVQAADCYAVGQTQAAERGGTLAAANDAVQNGQQVCRIIVVVPGQNGERPRRVETIVPKG